MDVKFIRTTSDQLDNLPIVNGQLIVLTDESGCYYDMSDTRYPISASGGGHVIKNSSGTSLAQRANLQFTGYLNASDDSANDATVVSAAPTTVTWATWQTMSDQQKEGTHWLIVDAPSISDQFVAKSGDSMTGTLTVNSASEPQATFSKQNTSTTSAVSSVVLGNSIAEGTAGSTYGRLIVCGKGAYRTDLVAPNSSANRTITLPDAAGTVALAENVVAKSGDTMTGTLYLNRPNAELQLYATHIHTDTTTKKTRIVIGNNTADGTAGASYGSVQIFGDSAYCSEIQARGITTQNRIVQLPDKNGTIALISDVDAKVSKSGDTMTGDLTIDDAAGTTTSDATSRLILGNSTPSGTAGNSQGFLRLYGKGQYRVSILDNGVLTANRDLYFPDASGTILTNSEIYTDKFVPTNPTSLAHAIYQLHVALGSDQKCECLVAYSTSEIFVTGYKHNSTRGRYLAMTRTGQEIYAYKIEGTNQITQNSITGTITTETFS